ncbi:glycosyltransferase [Flavobacterium sp.]|uniref:glycosyltransferase n=1 Tax=Flavobacterium sp. TaxID=239 RepID=UPI0026320699|nr:glycosyltransferase [Flavobacterium sp.]
MKLIFVTEARFTKDANGNMYGESSFNFELWDRYLQAFSEVIVMARVIENVDFIGESTHLSSAEKVSFVELPYYVGPFQYLKIRKALNRKIKEVIETTEAVYICRIPGNISNVAINYLNRLKIPFGAEVVGDPWDVFAKGSISHPLRSYFRWKGYLDLKKNVKKAAAVLYVTKNKLQERYPAESSAFQVSASNVKIKEGSISRQNKTLIQKGKYSILSIGSLEQMYKSPDIVIKAISIINNQGIPCDLVWLGDGIYKEKMDVLARQLNVEKNIDFKGNVSSEMVQECLLKADVFVLASRTEGLPRAMIEAMSAGLPCIGTNVGGIPELLEPSFLIEKNNPQLLAQKIVSLIQNEQSYKEQSIRNLKESMSYSEPILQKKRQEFYEYLINLKQSR